jgi:L-aminopeptidase/D-esterase-like protein
MVLDKLSLCGYNEITEMRGSCEMRVGITDIEGISVGHASDLKALTGVTVILAPEGMTGGVAIHGFATSTRQIDALSPSHIVPKVHAICLTGGSAFGLDAASGVMEYLEGRGSGFDMGVARIPIVPTAAIFDLRVGSAIRRPDHTMGYLACQNATSKGIAEGSVGAGTGATVGKFYGIDQAMKGGIGVAVEKGKGGLIVGALAVVNAFGDVKDPSTGKILAGARIASDSMTFADTRELMKRGVPRPSSAFQNTTIGVILTNAKLDKQSASMVAKMASLGMVKTLSPGHTIYDGDIMFSLSSGKIKADYQTVGLMAEDVLAQAILRGITKAEGLKGIPSFAQVATKTRRHKE